MNHFKDKAVLRVVVEALVCFLIVGAILYELGDFTTKTNEKEFWSQESSVAARAANWFWKYQTMAVAPKIPTGCLNGTSQATLGSLKNACSYLNGQKGCCVGNSQPDLPLQTVLQSYDKMCSQTATEVCKTSLINYWCTFSCATANAIPCELDLLEFAKDCTNSCPELLLNGLSPNASVPLDQFRKDATAAYGPGYGPTQTSNNCTKFLKQPTDLSVPAIILFKTTVDNSVLKFDVNTKMVDWQVTVTSATLPRAQIVFQSNGNPVLKVNVQSWTWKKSSSKDSWNADGTVFLQSNQFPAGQASVNIVARNTFGDSNSVAKPFTVTTAVVALGVVSLCNSVQFVSSNGSAVVATSLACAAGCTCEMQNGDSSKSTDLQTGAVSQSGAELKFRGKELSLLKVFMSSFVANPGATTLVLAGSSVRVSGTFDLSRVPFYNFSSADSSSSVTFESAFSQVATTSIAIEAVVVFSKIAATFADASKIRIWSGGKLTLAKSVLSCAADLTKHFQVASTTKQSGFDASGGASDCSANLIGGMMRLGNGAYKGEILSNPLTTITRRYDPKFVTVSVCNAEIGSQIVTANSQLLIETSCIFLCAGALATDPQVKCNLLDTNAKPLQLSGRTSTTGTADIIVKLNSYLTFDHISANSNPFQANGVFAMDTTTSTDGPTIEIILAPNGFLTNVTTVVTLLRFPVPTASASGVSYDYCATAANTLAQNGIKTVFEPAITGRTTVLSFVYESTATATKQCLMQLTVGAVTSVAPGYTSGAYQLALMRDCSVFTDPQFYLIVASITNLTSSDIVITKKTCGSMILTYVCKSTTSLAAANAICNTFSTLANTKGTDLYLALQTITLYDNNRNGTSDNALYALYVLILLPIICVAIFIIWYRTRQHEADNQYLQDTQTFSSVAAHNAPYDPTKSVQYPPQPVVASPGYVH